MRRTRSAEPPSTRSLRPAGVTARLYSRPGRARRVYVRLSDEEYTAIAAAAKRAGYTPGGFVAEVGLAAAGVRDEVPPSVGNQRELLIALNQARDQVARIGTNLNQAVARLNATGEPPPWLDRAVELTSRAVLRVEDAANEVVAGLPDGRPRRRLYRAV